MTLPPDDDEMKGGPVGIDEPPRDDENDTRPLKPMRVRPQHDRRSGASAPPPAATILREAGFEAPRPAHAAPPAEDDDTNRVRVVPRLPNPPAWRVIFQIAGSTHATVGLDVRQALVIGRAESDSDELPGLDLTPHLGLQAGVSRQHAVLIPTPEALFISDLGSTNGTWLNGEYLEPGERYVLSAGDRLELGLLKMALRTVATINRASGS